MFNGTAQSIGKIIGDEAREKFADSLANEKDYRCDYCGIDLRTLAGLFGAQADPNFHRMQTCIKLVHHAGGRRTQIEDRG